MAIRSTRGEELFGTVYPKGAVVFREGDEGDAFYLIQSGAVEVSRETGGHKGVLALLERGDFFGEMAIVDDERRSATVTAIADTRLLPITRVSFRRRVRRDPGMALHLLRTLCARIESTRWEHGDCDAGPAELAARVSLPFAYSRSELVEVAAGSTLFRQGDPGDAVFLIVDGQLEVRREIDGETRIVAHLGSRDIVGEMGVITGRPRAATVVAVVPSTLLAVPREDFLERVGRDPDLALHVVQTLVLRLRAMLDRTAPAKAARGARRRWPAVPAAGRPLRTAIVSLSSCGGCAAVFLEDPDAFTGGLARLEVVYCPMLMDQRSFPHVDLAIVDGAVRGKEDRERLEEARAKSRYLIASGTCAASGGLPALANRFELEDVVTESFGRAQDLFGHYLAGTQEIDGPSNLIERLALLRTASGIGDCVKVDRYVAGCPPPLGPLTQVIGEIGGAADATGSPGRERKPVCSDCPRIARKDPVTEFRDFPGAEVDPAACLASRGVLCLGFLSRGGCGAPCPQGGLPCWGCRGVTEAALRKIAEGETLAGLSLDGLARISRLEAEKIRPALKRARSGGLNVLSIGHVVGDNPRSR